VGLGEGEAAPTQNLLAHPQPLQTIKIMSFLVRQQHCHVFLLVGHGGSKAYA